MGGAISFKACIAKGHEPCVFLSKTPENDNLIASSFAHIVFFLYML